MMKQDIWRCQFHLTPPTGWMNDPNGICQFQGLYHVFFQYAPDYPEDMNKSWGHYISRDMVHWDFIGTTFYPDTIYDRDGAFSGNTFIENDTMVIYYTGNVEQDGDHDYTHSGRESNTIRVTSKDGIHFSDKECVLNQYPAGYTCHIRDPKIWKEADTYKMVLGGRKNDDRGAILIFQSRDGIHWEFSHDATSTKPFGFMWECPDIFEMNGEWYLSCCPQGVTPEEYRYQNYHLSGYVPISKTKPIIDETQFQEWDYGFDFYAPQTFVDESGRRILIGWVGGPDMTYEEPTLKHHNWIHKLTVPRVVTKQGNRLLQTPIPELDTLHGKAFTLINGEWFTTKTNAFDWQLECAVSEEQSFEINITTGLRLTYANQILALQFSDNSGAGRTVRKVLCKKVDNLRLLMDCSVLEIFINDGAIVQTTHFFPETSQLAIRAIGDFTKNCLWDMDINL